MLSNILRVLFIKVTTRHMQKRSRKYQKLYEDELGAYYCARPMMAKEIAGNARAFFAYIFSDDVDCSNSGNMVFFRRSQKRGNRFK